MSVPTDLKERIARILAEEVAPALQLDGTAIDVLDVIDGVVQVRLGAGCCTCPSTLMTVIHGLEQELRRRVSGVEYLEVLP